MRYPLNPIRIVCLVFLVLLAPHAHADIFIIDTTESLLGFVNHKRGLAKMFIEDPLSYPTAYTMDIELDPSLESGGINVRITDMPATIFDFRKALGGKGFIELQLIETVGA